MQNIRLFVACEVPYHVKTIAVEIQRNLIKQQIIEGNYVLENAMHVTLKFIGPVDLASIPAIQNNLRTISSETMQVFLNSVGIFGNYSSPKVIYIGLDSPSLSKLAAKIDFSLSGIVSVETRPFCAHLTLVRVKKILHHTMLYDWLDHVSIDPLSFPINNFVLMQSETHDFGPKYSVIERYYLNTHSITAS